MSAKYEKRPVEWVAATLAACRREPTERSFRAALRIGREQTLARGDAGAQVRVARVATGLAALGAGLFLVPAFASFAVAAEGSLVAAAILLWFGWFASRTRLRTEIADSAEIARLAREALTEIASAVDRPIPLRWDERIAVERLFAPAPVPFPIGAA